MRQCLPLSLANLSPPLNSTALRRTAAIVWNRRHVTDHLYVNARALDGADRRFAPRTGPFHANFDRAHPAVARDPGGLVGGLLRCEGGAFARPAEPHGAGRALGDEVAVEIGDAHEGVVESGLNVDDALRHDLFLFLLENLLLA